MNQNVVVIVPWLRIAEVNLHHPDALLHQPAGHQASAAKIAIAIAVHVLRAIPFVMSKTSGASVCIRKAISAD